MIHKCYTASLFAVFIVIFMISSNFSRSQIALPFPYIAEKVYADDSSSNGDSSSNSDGGEGRGGDESHHNSHDHGSSDSSENPSSDS